MLALTNAPAAAEVTLVRLSLAILLSLSSVLPSPALAQEVQRAVLSLVVNQVDKGDIIVILKPGDVLVRVEDLEHAGLRVVGGQREIVEATDYVAVASLAPGIVFEFDERALALRLTARSAFLPSTVLDLQAGRPPGLVYREDTSAFLNYAAQTTNFNKFSVFTEAGLQIKNALLFSSASRNEDGSVVRGLSNLQVDDRSRLVRWLAGDFVSRPYALSGSLLMGGLNVSREFSLDPYFLRFPTVNLAGSVATPATADVYVNGLLLRRTELSPGPFELKNLQTPTGSGAARVVIRDAFGREQVVQSSFYFTTRLLAEGLQDYSYSLGFRRDNFGTASWDYGGHLGFSGQHRVGLTDTLTVGGRLQATSNLVSGGPSVNVGLPFGEIELAAAGSREENFSGAAVSLAYQYTGKPISVGGAVRALSDHYATLQLSPNQDRARVEANAFVGVQLGPRTDLTVQYTRSDFRDQGSQDRASAFLSVRLSDRLSLFLSGSRSTRSPGGTTTEGFALLSVFLGERTTGAISYQRSSASPTNTGTIEVQRSLPVGTGFGYRVQASTSDTTPQGNATLQYQGPWGRYEASYQNSAGSGSTTVSVAGAIAAIGGTVFASRPLTDSFALIRVPGVEGVRGYLNNQEVGTTDRRGDLPVPDLLAYYGNRLGIADTDIPLEYSVAEKERTVATPFRGGAIVAFPVQLIRAVTGRVVMITAGETVIPAFGQLTVTVNGRPFDSPIGRDGEFYLDNVPAGRHSALIEHEKGQCSFTLEVPAAVTPVIDLGTLPCAVP